MSGAVSVLLRTLASGDTACVFKRAGRLHGSGVSGARRNTTRLNHATGSTRR